MTLKDEIAARIAAVQAKAQADAAKAQAEVAELQAHLASGATWLEQEAAAVHTWIDAIVARVRAQL
jgi:hypothetical protein